MENAVVKSSNRIHPLVATAAGAVIIASAVGVAAMTGLLPKAHGNDAPAAQSLAQAASTPAVVAQAAHLASLVRATPELELMAPESLNIVCFRYRGDGGSPQQLNDLNQELLIRLHEGGKVAPSYTTLGGNYCLRAAIANHRTRSSDLAILIEEVLRIGRELRAG